MNRLLDLLETFKIDQSRDSITLGEALGELQFVLRDATDDVVGHANIKRAAKLAG